jgi:glycolate oxidase
MLLLEFDEGDLDRIAHVIANDIGPRYSLSRPVEIAHDLERQAALWKVRRAVLPRIIQRPGSRRAWGFVEDPVVPRGRVAEFIEFLSGLARQHGTEAGIYGHVGDGNTHFRPFFDPTNSEDFEHMVALRAEFHRAVLERFRGVPSGEHGIGRIRADVVEPTWGSEVYAIMRRIKEALDPAGLLNPGVLFSTDPWWSSWAGLESRSPM